MQKFSIFSLARNALTHHANWQLQWRSPEPKKSYKVIIFGGGGHGLATACYLVKSTASPTSWSDLLFFQTANRLPPQYSRN